MTGGAWPPEVWYVLKGLILAQAICAIAILLVGVLLGRRPNADRDALRRRLRNLWRRFWVWAAISGGLLVVNAEGGMVLAASTGIIGVLALREVLRAGRRAFPAAATFAVFTAVALLWIGGPLWLLNDLRAQAGGFFLAAWIMLSVAIADIAAMFGGLLLGRHHPFPGVSGGKTLEGMVAGVLGGMGTAAALLPAMQIEGPDPGAGVYFSATMLLVIAGVAGDLAASALKRKAGIKDFGCALPGHGGVMDRLDSLLFALPAGWLAVRYLWS